MPTMQSPSPKQTSGNWTNFLANSPKIYATSHIYNAINNLKELYGYSITTITQIQIYATQHSILSPQEFKIKSKAFPKLTKEALQQAKILFPIPIQPIATPPTQEPLHALNTSNDNQYVGKQKHIITNTKTTSYKDKWGAQAIKKPYLCQCNTIPITIKWVARAGGGALVNFWRHL